MPLFANGPAAAPRPDGPAVAEVLDRIHERVRAVPEPARRRISVRSTVLEMDKDWMPGKRTVIERAVAVDGDMRTEEVLSAVESEDGRTRDVTAKFRAEAAKLNAKNATREGKAAAKKGQRHRGLDLSRDELFPFGAERRGEYEFKVRGEAEGAAPGTLVLESRSKVEAPDRFEGAYTVDAGTFDVLKADLRPAKLPGPLKRLEMSIAFERLAEGFLVIRLARVRVHVGLIIKNVRVESEDVFTSYEFPG